MAQAVLKSMLVGGAIGALLAILLILNGAVSGWEALEGSMYFALLLGLPISLVSAVGFGEYAHQWVLFMSLVLPLNGALWGFLVGAAIHGLRRRAR